MTKAPKFTQQQADATQGYINTIRDLLGLQHWDVFLAREPAPKGAYAAIAPVEGRQVAPLSVERHWFRDRSPEGKRNDIVHELLHVVHRDQTDVIRLGLVNSEVLGSKVRELTWALFNTETERMVDHLASVISPFMPPFPDV